MNDEIRSYLDRVLQIVGRQKVACVVAYGSSLSAVTRSSTSTPDFFVIVDAYPEFYASRFHAILNAFLPPNVYHYKLGNSQSKYSVVSLTRLRKESRFPSDLYLAGRFSKKIEVAWSRNEATTQEVLGIQRACARAVAEKTLPLMPARFSLDEFCQAAIRLSYLGDVRVEAKDKIQKLFDADPAFYRETYAPILVDLGIAREETGYRKDPHPADAIRRLLVQGFLLSCKIRAQLRWPKAMFTASDWLDYVLQKIERTQGIRIDLTARQKKLWFIYGWKYFLLLKRKNLIK